MKSRHLKGLGGLVAISGLVLAACGSDDQGGSGGEGGGEQVVRYAVTGYQYEDSVDSQGQPVTGMKGLLEQFEAEHPGVTVEMIEIPTDGQAAKLQTLIMSEGADVIGGSPWALHKQGLVMDITDRVEEADLAAEYYDGAFESATRTLDPSSDKIIGLPGRMDVPTVAYDAQLFEDFGVEPLSENPTMDEIVSKAEQLTGTNPRTGEESFGLWIDGRWMNYLFMNYFLDYDDFAKAEPAYPESYANTDIAWNSPEIAGAIQKVIDVLACCAPQGFVTSQGNENWGAEKNNVAILPYVYPSHFDTAKELGLTDRFKLTNGIRFDGDKAYTVATQGFFLPENTKNADLAWELATFLSGPDGQKFMYENYGEIPSVKDTSFVTGEYEKEFTALIERGGIAPDGTPFFVSDFRPRLNRIITSGIQGDSVDIQGELDSVQDAWERWKPNN